MDDVDEDSEGRVRRNKKEDQNRRMSWQLDKQNVGRTEGRVWGLGEKRAGCWSESRDGACRCGGLICNTWCGDGDIKVDVDVVD